MVALFNAVAKAKREKAQAESKTKSLPLAQHANDDDDHSLGSLRELQTVHKRNAQIATSSESESKNRKTNWSVVSSTSQQLPAGWDQDEEDD